MQCFFTPLSHDFFLTDRSTMSCTVLDATLMAFTSVPSVSLCDQVVRRAVIAKESYYIVQRQPQCGVCVLNVVGTSCFQAVLKVCFCVMPTGVFGWCKSLLGCESQGESLFTKIKVAQRKGFLYW